MSDAGGKTALVTAALIVAGIRMWEQLRGQAKTPFAEWAVGWGATFFILSLVSEVAAPAAGMLALIIVVAEFVTKGASLAQDVSSTVTGTENDIGGPTGNSPFVSAPFASVQDVTTPQNSNGKVKTS